MINGALKRKQRERIKQQRNTKHAGEEEPTTKLIIIIKSETRQNLEYE